MTTESKTRKHYRVNEKTVSISKEFDRTMGWVGLFDAIEELIAGIANPDEEGNKGNATARAVAPLFPKIQEIVVELNAIKRIDEMIDMLKDEDSYTRKLLYPDDAEAETELEKNRDLWHNAIKRVGRRKLELIEELVKIDPISFQYR